MWGSPRHSPPEQGTWQHQNQHLAHPALGKHCPPHLTLGPLCPTQHQPWHCPGPPKGSSLPGLPRGRIFTSLNLPWLQVLWAAASLMLRAWASQCSPVADWQNEPGRREASKHCRHFGGVCAAPQIAPRQDGTRSTSTAQPVWEKWGTGHSGSHRSQGKRGVHEQEGLILSVHSSDSLWVWAKEQAQAGLSSWKAASTWCTDMGIARAWLPSR